MKKILPAVLLAWLGLVASSYWWNSTSERAEEDRLALETARTYLLQILTTREWNAKLGGVYIFTSPENHPNPYLLDPERDITLPDGRVLTKVNPAYMTRQLSELAAKSRGYRFRLTGPKPLRPDNAPNDWERKALKAFDSGAAEYGCYTVEGGERAYVYMAPVRATPECVKCHAVKGYREGDILGGISVTMLYPPQLRNEYLAYWHMLIALIGSLIISILGHKLEKAYEKSRREADIDPLTRIFNRRYFMHRYRQDLRIAQRTGQPMSLIMIDVDHFKLYNDNYGHLEGDQCLVSIAAAIHRALQRPADLCARFGGEEFIVLLPDTSETGALHVAERIRSGVAEADMPHGVSPVDRRVTVSIGVALVGAGNVIPAQELQFIDAADAALYRAKNAGRNRIEFSRI